MTAFTREDRTVNGTRVEILTAGEGEPLVFFHGAGTFTGFDYLLPLAEKFRVYVPIHPGFGGSDEDPELETIDDYVLHYADLFQDLGLTQGVNLVGHSMGGWLAAKFATVQGNLLQKLVLVAPVGLHVPDHPTIDIFKVPPDGLPKLLVEDFEKLKPYLPAEVDSDFILSRYREMTTLARIMWDRNFDPRLEKWLHRIAVPTLLVWGEEDRCLPVGQASVWQAALPHASVKTLSGVGHLPLLETDAANRQISAFLA